LYLLTHPPITDQGGFTFIIDLQVFHKFTHSLLLSDRSKRQ
jgi:hypothetical protein